MENNLDVLLGTNYDPTFFATGEEHTKLLKEKGILVFPEFINDFGLGQIQKDMGWANEKTNGRARQSKRVNN